MPSGTAAGINKPDTNTINVESGATLTNKSGGTVALATDSINTVSVGAIVTGLVRTIRRRCTIAEINAGVELLAAVAGYKYRMVRATAISVGGSAAAVTTVDILGTQGAAGVKLAAFAQASLTQSAVLTAGGSGGAVLADGVSFVANDTNTAVTVGKTGASVTTATHIDIEVQYVQEAA